MAEDRPGQPVNSNC